MREKTPSFVLELPLKVSPKQEKQILSRFESARQLYNALLGEGVKRVHLIKQSNVYQQARKLKKDDKNRNNLFKQASDAYNFTEYSFQEYACELRHKLKNNLDCHTVQKLATRAFYAVEKLLYGKAKKVRFKGYNQINSVESKSNDAGIRWRENQIEWSKLILKPIINLKDIIVKYGLEHRIKYCRIIKRTVKGRIRFYVQLILEGVPFIKEKNKLGNGTVCFDFGPSSIAIVAMKKDNNNNEFHINHSELKQFCSELKPKEKQKKRIQRKIDRQKRKNNPNNYDNETNKIKKGKHKWIKSKRQLENEGKLKEIYRTTSEHRKSLQGKLVNETLRLGNSFKTEKISGKWLQKLYGKSVGTRAPGMFVSHLNRKAVSAGGSFDEFPTRTTKLSQVCCCGRQKKKSLSERVHDCECGIHAQRDLFSAFLGLFVDKTVNVERKDKKEAEFLFVLQADQAQKAWSSADTLLRTAWEHATKSVSGSVYPSSFGKPSASKASLSQSGSFVKERIAEFEVQDVVPVACYGESLEENKVFPFRTYGVSTPV